MKFREIEWKNYKGLLLPSVPPHQEIHLNKDEQKKLLNSSGAFIARWISLWDLKRETEFWYVIKDSFGGMAELKSNMRTQVRKGLKLCTVEKIDSAYLLQNGYDIYRKAFISYKKKDTSIGKIPTEKDFISIYKKVAEKSEFWGVFEKETSKFIAFSENVCRDGAVIYGSMKFDPDYLKIYPSYALIFRMNEYYLGELKLKYVSDGPRSLLHETNIQEMLIRKFNFRKAYCKIEMTLSPYIEIGVWGLYPFRKFIYQRKTGAFQKMSTVLKMREISRSYD